MRNQNKKVVTNVPDSSKHIKVQLDSKTTVIVRDMDAYEAWHAKYINSRIIN